MIRNLKNRTKNVIYTTAGGLGEPSRGRPKGAGTRSLLAAKEQSSHIVSRCWAEIANINYLAAYLASLHDESNLPQLTRNAQIHFVKLVKSIGQVVPRRSWNLPHYISGSLCVADHDHLSATFATLFRILLGWHMLVIFIFR